MTARVSQSLSATAAPLPARATFHLADAEATRAAGERLARAVRGGLLVTLAGDLGTGKTTLVRGLLRSLGWRGAVKSPTYALVEHYSFPSLYFYHFDLYRLSSPDEWESGGFGEYLSEKAVVVVEWPERAGDHLACADLAISLAYPPGGPELGRDVAVEAFSEAGRACLNAILPGASASS